MTIDFAALAAPFSPDVVHWRVGPTNKDKSKGMALAYVDARDVMERLDEVCGPHNWQNKYPHANGKTVCEIGIRVLRKQEGAPEWGDWVWKSDGAGDTGTEAEKGALSDAFKRAAVRWGIGRYLYDMTTPWVDIEQRGRSYVIKDDQLPKLRRLLDQRAPATQPESAEPTESEQRIYKMMEFAAGQAQTVTDLHEWWGGEDRKKAWSDLPTMLQLKLKQVVAARRDALTPKKKPDTDSTDLLLAG